MKLRSRLSLYLILLLSPAILLAEFLPAFPGAEGFGPRIVVFDVSGVIHGDVTIRNPDITIAGETAPGGGIAIPGRFLASYNYSMQNIIVRFIRIRNNVIYNVRDCFVHDNPSNNGGFNIVGNYYRKGLNQPDNFIFPFGFRVGIEYYVSDNYIDHPPYLDQIIEDPWTEGQDYVGLAFYSDRGIRATTPFEMPPVETHSAEEVYRIVLEKAGAWPRDIVTLRTVDEVRRRTGEWARQVPDDLMAGLTPESPPLDSDGDGIPDYWKIMHGMDPNTPDANGDFNGNGYTNIEDYLHYRAALLIGERWNSYPVTDGWVDTHDWIERLFVEEDPWIFSARHNAWLFQPQLTQGKYIFPEWWFVPKLEL